MGWDTNYTGVADSVRVGLNHSAHASTQECPILSRLGQTMAEACCTTCQQLNPDTNGTKPHNTNQQKHQQPIKHQHWQISSQ